MTALEYWEKQFPERMSKATDRERKLLAAQDPRNWTVHTERDLEDLIVLLKDFDTKCQQGKAMESLFFRREDRKMKELSDRNNTANASCQAIGAALLGVGISLEGEWWVTRAALAGLGVGIMLLGRTAWGIRKTQQAIWDNMCSRLGIKPTPEVMAASIISARQIMRLIIFLPISSLSFTLASIATAGATHTDLGNWIALGGAVAILVQVANLVRLSQGK